LKSYFPFDSKNCFVFLSQCVSDYKDVNLMIRFQSNILFQRMTDVSLILLLKRLTGHMIWWHYAGEKHNSISLLSTYIKKKTI